MPPKPPHRLRHWINERGLKHAWVAQRLGYSPQYLSRILNGSNPITAEFRERCTTHLEVPAHIWSQDER